MIITLKGANFALSNIGTLSSWRISRSLGAGATYDGVYSVDKGASFTATVSVAEGYEIVSDGVTVTMGGQLISAATINGNLITIYIAAVTGNVTIRVPTVNISTGEEDGGDIEDGTFDAATVAYLSATGILDMTMASKLDILVRSLKSNNLWDKIEALYPCVGTTFTQMSYNLRNPNTYRLTCAGEPTIVANDSMYHATELIRSDTPTRLGSDLHLMGCSGTPVSEVEIVCPTPSNKGGNPEGVSCLILKDYMSLRTVTDQAQFKATFTEGTYDGTGIIIGSLTSGIMYNGQDMKATKTGTPSVTVWDPVGFAHNGSNSSADGKLMRSQKTRLSGFGYAMTIEEMKRYSEILNNFKSIY